MDGKEAHLHECRRQARAQRNTPCIPRLFAHQSCVATPYSPEWKAVKSCFLGAAVFTSFPVVTVVQKQGKKTGEVSVKNIGERGKETLLFVAAVGPFSSTHTSCNQT